MTYPDLHEVMRNPATVAAYREHRRAVCTAAQPWITLVPALAALSGSPSASAT